jgi:hypothetical protein
MIEYSSKSSDDEEANMCVAEWSWGSKSKPFVYSSLKPASKSRQDSMRYTFDVVGGHKMHIFTANIPTFYSRYRRYVLITNKFHEFY